MMGIKTQKKANVRFFNMDINDEKVHYSGKLLRS